MDTATPVPVPVAWFPLAQDLSSWPEALVTGSGSGITFEPDATFGQALTCRHESLSAVQLGPVPLSSGGGAMTVAFWASARPGSLAGDDLAYLLSVGPPGGQPAGAPNWFSPNQLHLFLPEAGNPAYGVLRAILKDADDATTQTYLDSDGRIGSPAGPREPTLRPWLDGDGGRWHHLALSTLPGGGEGYAVYLDGVPVARMTETNAVEGRPDGGGAFAPSPITLCGRSDGQPDRHFEGRLAHLQVWDQALDAAQIAALFEPTRAANPGLVGAPTSAGGASPASPAPPAARVTVDGDDCLLPFIAGASVAYGCVLRAGSSPAAPVQEVCKVADGSFKECAPGVAVEAASPASSPTSKGAKEAAAPTVEPAAPTVELVAPTAELAAPTVELAAPTEELAAPTEEAPVQVGDPGSGSLSAGSVVAVVLLCAAGAVFLTWAAWAGWRWWRRHRALKAAQPDGLGDPPATDRDPETGPPGLPEGIEDQSTALGALPPARDAAVVVSKRGAQIAIDEPLDSPCAPVSSASTPATLPPPPSASHTVDATSQSAASAARAAVDEARRRIGR